jgi:Arc/MetJ family transcription regulator
VTVTQIDLDAGLLEQASVILGTHTKKATVNEALRRVVQDQVRRAHLEDLAGGALPDLADARVMDSAWR